MKRYSLKNILLILISIIIFNADFNILSAQPELKTVTIAPLNRAYFQFTSLPLKYNSQLNNDKKRISVIIKNAKLSESARQTHGSGIIQDVYCERQKGDINALVTLNNKRGYNAVPLDYSQQIMLEVFEWDKLTPVEDSYREGLLAYESGIFPSAKKNLIKAVTGNNANAAYFLGIIYLKEGQATLASKLFDFAEKYHSDIPDVFSAISQTAKYNGNLDKSNIYSKKFLDISHLSKSPDLIFPQNVAEDTSKDVVLLKNFLTQDLSIVEASKTMSSIDTAKKDTAKKQFSNLFKEDSAKANKKGYSIFSDINPFMFGFVTIILLILGIILLFSYFSWRKKQLIKINEKPKPDFKKKLKRAEAKLPNSALAARTYQDIEEKSELTNDKKPIQNLKQENIQEKKKLPEKEEDTKKFQPKQENLAEMISKITASLSKSEKANKYEIPDDIETITADDDIIDNIDNKKQLTPKLELALHLQDEQQKLKQKNISSIDPKTLSVDSKKMVDVARKLGVEMQSLETRKAISQLESNKDSLSKLADKFSIKKDNKK